MTPSTVTIPITATGSLSLWALFWEANFVVQLVMLGLLAASFWSWTIIISKTLKLRSLFSTASRFEEAFWSGGSLEELYERLNNQRDNNPMVALFCMAMREWRRSFSKGIIAKGEARGTIQQRIERVMQVTQTREMERLERHMGFLSSVASTSVLVGLLGTVIGIMHSFQNIIGQQQSATLAVVAPGISEALFATAIGLVAAIPASIAYNRLNSELGRYATRLEMFASEFNAIISRQLEENAYHS